MTRFQSTSDSVTLKNIKNRLQVQHLLEPALIISSGFGSDAVKGLTQMPKTLPPRYFYDDRGSELFEQICALPEYYLTRTETEILQKCAGEIVQITGACEIVELGSGSSTKTRILLNAYQQQGLPLRYLPIDVSAGMLEKSAIQLLVDYPSLQIHALAGTYELALSQLQPSQLSNRMICFLGSSLGNLNPQECDVFLSEIVAALQVGEYFLLGIDLQKPKPILEAAYNDAQGVTAAFNLNVLEHLNRRFAANFDLQQFTHWAFYNETEHQIEMHLQSRRSQTVELAAVQLQIDFAPGETIRTEISRKFHLDVMQQQLKAKGLVPQKIWTDDKQWFGLLPCQLQAT